MQEHSATTTEMPVPVPEGPPDWLEEAREGLDGPGDHLVYRDDDRAIVSFRIERGWTRIGRSSTADLQLAVDPADLDYHAKSIVYGVESLPVRLHGPVVR